VQNVVTYTIIAQAPNPDLSLLPGMTATARVIIEERANAIRIPNSALRYTPVAYQTPQTTQPQAAAAQQLLAAGQATGQLSPDQAARLQQFATGAGGGGQAAAGGNRGAAAGNAQAAAGNAKNANQGAGQAAGQNAGGTAGNAKNATAGGNQGAQGGAAAGAAGAALAQLGQLGLSAEQTQQITQAIAAARTQAQAGGGTQQEVQQRMQQAQRQAILAALTPDQRTRFVALEAQQGAGGQAAPAQGQGAAQQLAQAAAGGDVRTATAGGARNAASRARAARVFVLGADGKPTPINIMIGITDGGFTEMVQGDLPTGTRVITGSNEVAAAPTTTNNPFGMFGFGGGGGPPPQVFLK
jgi:hypothetical protein